MVITPKIGEVITPKIGEVYIYSNYHKEEILEEIVTNVDEKHVRIWISDTDKNNWEKSLENLNDFPFGVKQAGPKRKKKVLKGFALWRLSGTLP